MGKKASFYLIKKKESFSQTNEVMEKASEVIENTAAEQAPDATLEKKEVVSPVSEPGKSELETSKGIKDTADIESNELKSESDKNKEKEAVPATSLVEEDIIKEEDALPLAASEIKEVASLVSEPDKSEPETSKEIKDTADLKSNELKSESDKEKEAVTTTSLIEEEIIKEEDALSLAASEKKEDVSPLSEPDKSEPEKSKEIKDTADLESNELKSESDKEKEAEEATISPIEFENKAEDIKEPVLVETPKKEDEKQGNKEAGSDRDITTLAEKKEKSVEETPQETEVSIESEKDEDDEGDEEETIEEITEETFKSHSLEELVLELEKINESDNIQNTKNKVGFIRLIFGQKIEAIKQQAKESFLESGGEIEQYNPEPIPLEEKFKAAFNKYKSLSKKYRQQQEIQMQENLQQKKELLEEMRELIGSNETLKATYDKFNEIQNRWKDIGMVPKAEIQVLWNNYHFLVEKFFDKVHISKELRNLDLKKNLDAKIELCEKTEELLIEKSVNKSFKLLQEYHNEWKAIGPVPSANNDEIWERFKTASDKINERRKEHYQELQTNLEENLQAKQALCVKAEELLLKPAGTVKEWNDRNEEFDELFKVWRTFGPAPKKHNEEIWATFKGLMNQFYDAKKSFFKELKSEQQENYHKKLDLLQQAEALKESTDWGNTTTTLIKLQKEWKKIGPVPRKHSNHIWKKFREANDFFFNAKSNFFKGQFEVEEKNLDAKKALIKEISETEYSDNKKDNLKKIKVFQRQWSEIGNVPRKEMDKLYKSYREAIDKQLDSLDISSSDFRNAGFKDRIDDLKKKEDTFALSKERQYLQKNIEKLNEDVLLWENNMGFFRHSKNADVLKMEFEKKIQKAKAEILMLKQKMREINK
jgi:hypothetical protein